MIGKASNPMLEKAEEAIQAKVPAQLQGMFRNAVLAGQHILYAPQLHETLQHRLQLTKDPVKDTAAGAARMVTELFKQSGKKIPGELLVPIGVVMALEYLDLLAKAGKCQISPQLIAQVATATNKDVLALLGITPEKIRQMAMANRNQQGTPPAGGIIAQQQPQPGA